MKVIAYDTMPERTKQFVFCNSQSAIHDLLQIFSVGAPFHAPRPTVALQSSVAQLE
jgi:hypothetical protein